MGLTATLAMNGMIGLGGYWVARHGFRQPSGVPRFLASAVLAWAWLTLGMQGFGSLALIGRGPLLAWSAAILAAGMACKLRAPAASIETTAARGGWEASATWALGLMLWALVVVGVTSFLMPVKVVSDGPIYHLYFAARWWKQGRLFLIDVPFGESAATYFPAGGDLWFTWLMVGWGGDRLARIGQAPFLGLAAVAVYGLARRLGVGVPAAWIAVTWFVTCLPVLHYSFEANVDTIFIAGYLTAAYFLARHALGDGHGGTLVLAGLAAGLAWGTKPTATVFVPVLLALGALVVASRPDSHGVRLGHLALLGLTPLVPSGYWFGRGLALAGNPLYPLRIAAFGRVWLAGWYESSEMLASQFYLPVENWRALIDILLAVFDPRLVPFWLAATAGAWAVGGSRSPNMSSGPLSRADREAADRHRRRDRLVWACAALAVANIALYWMMIPYRSQQRFMIQAVGLAAVPLGRLLDRGRWLRQLAVVLLAVHLLTAQSWPVGEVGGRALWTLSDLEMMIPPATISLRLPGPTWDDLLRAPARSIHVLSTLVVGLGTGAVTWTLVRAIRRPTPSRWTRALGAILLLIGLDAAYLHWGAGYGRLRYPLVREYSRGWNALEALTARRSCRIAYAGMNMPYYLMGTDLRHEVRYINIDAHPGWRLHDYHRAALARGIPNIYGPRPGWNRLNPDARAWLANLKAAGIQWLVVTRANPIDGPYNIADAEGFPIERSWADAHPETFRLAYPTTEPDPVFRIYRLLPGGRPGPLARRRH